MWVALCDKFDPGYTAVYRRQVGLVFLALYYHFLLTLTSMHHPPLLKRSTGVGRGGGLNFLTPPPKIPTKVYIFIWNVC